MKKIIKNQEVIIIPESSMEELEQRIKEIESNININNHGIIAGYIKFGDALGQSIADIKFKKYFLEDVQRDAYEAEITIDNIYYCKDEWYDEKLEFYERVRKEMESYK